MNIRGSKGRPGWVAILAIALVLTSLQAKLGLYHPEHSQAQLVSKAFKISECRLERAVPEPPAAEIRLTTVIESPEDRQPTPDFLEYIPAAPHSVLVSSSYWFRPPPVRS